jgi:predicted porin
MTGVETLKIDKNNFLKIIIFALFVFPFILQADQPELFGEANLSIASLDDDNGKSTTISSHSSRIGVKGSISTEKSLEIIYRFVWQVDLTDEAKASNNNLKSREQYIGLKDTWGEVRAGRHDTPYKKAGKKNVEFFSDTLADWNNIITKSHDIRADDSISYYKKIGQTKMSAMYAAGKDSPEPGEENLEEIFSAGIDTKFSNLAFAIAYQDKDTVGTATKVVLGYKVSNTKVGLAVESIDNEDNTKATNAIVSAKHQLSETNSIRFVYGQAEAITPITEDATMTALAFDHKLHDKVVVYALLAKGNDNGLKVDADLDGEGSLFALGIAAKF